MNISTIYYKHLDTDKEDIKIQIEIKYNPQLKVSFKRIISKGYILIISVIKILEQLNDNNVKVQNMGILADGYINNNTKLSKKNIEEAVTQVNKDLPNVLEELIKQNLLTLKDGVYSPVNNYDNII